MFRCLHLLKPSLNDPQIFISSRLCLLKLEMAPAPVATSRSLSIEPAFSPLDSAVSPSDETKIDASTLCSMPLR